jgi:hypothetical protein
VFFEQRLLQDAVLRRLEIIVQVTLGLLRRSRAGSPTGSSSGRSGRPDDDSRTPARRLWRTRSRALAFSGERERT